MPFNLQFTMRSVAGAKKTPADNPWYGLRFRDTFTKSGTDYDFTGLEFERTGKLAGYAQGLAGGTGNQPPEELLTVHNKLRRCVVDYKGKVKYYLHPDNSMWIDDGVSYQDISVTNAHGTVLAGTSNYNIVTDEKQVGNYVVEVNQPINANNIGCVMCIFDERGKVGKGAVWHAVIIDAYTTTENSVTKNFYKLSHPHVNGFGTTSEGYTLYYMIGNAKLGGQDGNVMVEIPAFWHKWSYEEDPEKTDDTNNHAYYGWQHHQISLKQLEGGHFFPKRYVAAFEGVIADESNVPQDGWRGTWNAETTNWDTPIETDIGGSPKLLSVAGYYPRTLRTVTLPNNQNFSVTNCRTLCDVGNGYHQYDATTNFIIQLLMIIELGHMDTQAGIGNGVSNVGSWSSYNYYRPVRKTGDTIETGNKTAYIYDDNITMPINKTDYRIESVSYRGIEHPYGHIFKFVDGIILSVSGAKAKAFAHKCINGGVAGYSEYTSSDPSTDTNYVKLCGIDGNDLEITNVGRYWKIPSPNLYPNDNAQSKTSGYCYDYFYQSGSDSLRAVAVGSRSTDGVRAGAFCVLSSCSLYSADYTYGGRLCKI